MANFFDEDQSPPQQKSNFFDESAPVTPSPSVTPPSAPSLSSRIMDVLTKPATGTGSATASVDEGVIPAMRDYVLAGWDAGTGGYGVPSALQAATKQAHQNLGPMDPIAQALGYSTIGGRILGPIARGVTGLAGLSGLGGSIAAGGLEGMGAGGIGAAGHGGDTSDIAKSAGMGLVGGAVAGATGGMGPKPKPPELGRSQTAAGPSTGMQAAKTAAYAPLDSIYFDSPTVSNAINQAQSLIRNVRDQAGLGASLDIPKSVNDRLIELQQNPVFTGRNLQQASRELGNSGDWTGHRFADALDNVLNTAQPLRGGQPGEAGAAKAAGDLWYHRIEATKALQEDPPNIAKAQNHFPSGVEAQALSALEQANQPKFNFYAARHIAAPIVGAGLGGTLGYFNPAEGQNPWLEATKEGIEGASIFTGLRELSKARPGSALNAARYAVGTGQPMSTATGRVGDYLANLLYGQLAGQPK